MTRQNDAPRSRAVLARVVAAFLRGALMFALISMAVAQSGSAGTGSYERTYRQSKSVVERALRQLQSSMGGRLPVLDGFALPDDYPLNRYERGYYESTVQVSSISAGGSIVRVTTKVTAWYSDPIESRSGYRLLISNGRIESDLLDQLTDLLGGSASATVPSRGNSHGASSETFPASAPPAAWTKPPASSARIADGAVAKKEMPEPAISAPVPSSPSTGTSFPPASPGLSDQQLADTKNQPTTPVDQATNTLQAEAASLEDVLKNQVHPTNLVAVKESGTPVVASPSLTAKTLFLASAHDEFEMLDFGADWVHVRISGLSRGWIWRTSLEMPAGISDVPLTTTSGMPVVADLFEVSRQETAPFPGDWAPLQGKKVEIISVEEVQEKQKGSGAAAKLEYAKSLLDKNYDELSAKASEIAGVVLIFDSVDGGMVAATLPTIRQWKAGTLTDAALWHQCYFDPPETFNVASAADKH